MTCLCGEKREEGQRFDLLKSSLDLLSLRRVAAQRLLSITLS